MSTYNEALTEAGKEQSPVVPHQFKAEHKSQENDQVDIEGVEHGARLKLRRRIVIVCDQRAGINILHNFHRYL